MKQRYDFGRTAFFIEHFLITTVIVILIIGCFYVLFGCYASIKSTNIKLNETFVQIKKDIQNDTAENINSSKDTTNLDFENQIKIIGSEVLNSNTISFLFQIFSIILVSAGIYILNRMNITSKKIEENVNLSNKLRENILPFIINHQHALNLISYTSHAYHLSFSLSHFDGEILSVNPIFNDSIKIITDLFKEAQKQKVGINNELLSWFEDRFVNINENVKKSKLPENWIKKYNTEINDLMKLLKNSSFIEIYQKQISL